MSLIERILDRLFKFREIPNCEKQVYLKRWYIIRTKRFGLFVHKFLRSDEDRALHDHPWHFLVIPIWRGYIEHNDRGITRVWPIISSRLRKATYKHRVELFRAIRWCDKDGVRYILPPSIELPSWSIFIRFTKFREWGFYLPTGWIPWTKWWSDKCE